MKVTDIAKAVAPNARYEIVGIRPGEKLHEIMFSIDDAIRTLEFKNHYVLIPTIKFYERPHNFISNPNGEKGTFVKKNFEYSSDKNIFSGSKSVNIFVLQAIIQPLKLSIDNLLIR